ncbi:unnamed protein product [Thelazia callipaeda]|uniref:Ovule protein n=1 Tax=Thelazia callipaeda TaxID=103827 RepID=A0A0N5DAV3_THECL|nr:unnamed protein product [Thelazia callipaeda]
MEIALDIRDSIVIPSFSVLLSPRKIILVITLIPEEMLLMISQAIPILFLLALTAKSSSGIQATIALPLFSPLQRFSKSIFRVGTVK